MSVVRRPQQLTSDSGQCSLQFAGPLCNSTVTANRLTWAEINENSVNGDPGNRSLRSSSGYLVLAHRDPDSIRIHTDRPLLSRLLYTGGIRPDVGAGEVCVAIPPRA